MRGEKEAVANNDKCIIGSSPHARGKEMYGLDVGDPCRIIPACAGKSHTFRITGNEKKDHPRMRGEK